ncbi:MAG TPA: hypothetical protein VGN42_10240, partial [Pirellulales bacterium]|nr:hypothetical protein [Pirellulales bacterium]
MHQDASLADRERQGDGPTALRAGSARARLAWILAFGGVLLVGAALRLAAPDDVEYKADEIWTFERTQADPQRPFPWLGMPSSAGMDNPGMSVW